MYHLCLMDPILFAVPPHVLDPTCLGCRLSQYWVERCRWCLPFVCPSVILNHISYGKGYHSRWKTTTGPLVLGDHRKAIKLQVTKKISLTDLFKHIAIKSIYQVPSFSNLSQVNHSHIVKCFVITLIIFIISVSQHTVITTSTVTTACIVNIPLSILFPTCWGN